MMFGDSFVIADNHFWKNPMLGLDNPIIVTENDNRLVVAIDKYMSKSIGSIGLYNQRGLQPEEIAL